MSLPVYAANKILTELGINTPEDLQLLEEIAYTRGAFVKEEPLTSSEARLTVFGDKAYITVSSLLQNPQRKRFSIAHELGHFEIHRTKSALLICMDKDIHEITGKIFEKEANEFASALLLPEQLFKPMCDQEEPSLQWISELTRLFNTSLVATTRRYIEFSNEPVALVYSINKHISWVLQSRELKEQGLFINIGRKLDNRTVAASSSSRQKRIVADAWFDEGYFDRDATIIEHSQQMPTYNAVLTLLWVDDEIINDNDDC